MYKYGQLSDYRSKYQYIGTSIVYNSQYIGISQQDN